MSMGVGVHFTIIVVQSCSQAYLAKELDDLSNIYCHVIVTQPEYILLLNKISVWYYTEAVNWHISTNSQLPITNCQMSITVRATITHNSHNIYTNFQ